MKLTVRFDITQLIEEEFFELGTDDWYIEMQDVPFLPQEGILTSFEWEDFVENKEIASQLDKFAEQVYIGEQTEIIYLADKVIVYIDLVKKNEERSRHFFLSSSFDK